MNLTACKDTHEIVKDDCNYDDQSTTNRSWDPIAMISLTENQNTAAVVVANLAIIASNGTSKTAVEVKPLASKVPKETRKTANER